MRKQLAQMSQLISCPLRPRNRLVVAGDIVPESSASGKENVSIIPFVDTRSMGTQTMPGTWLPDGCFPIILRVDDVGKKGGTKREFVTEHFVAYGEPAGKRRKIKETSLEVVPINRFHKVNSAHKRESLIGLNILEMETLKAGHLLHKVDNPVNGCRGKIFTFNESPGAVENGYIDVFYTCLSDDNFLNPLQNMVSINNNSDHYSVTFKVDSLRYWKWFDQVPPILFTLYVPSENKLVYADLRAYLPENPDAAFASGSSLEDGEQTFSINIPKSQLLNNEVLNRLRVYKNTLLMPPSLAEFIDVADISADASINERDLKVRVRAHQIGDIGGCVFEKQALLAGFSVDKIHQEEDYGIDYNLYTFQQDDLETGVVYVQVKAQEKSQYQDDCLFYPHVQTRHLNSWLASHQPVVLVVYDVATETAYWLDVQDYFSGMVLNDKYNTVKIPVQNVLDSSGLERIRQIKNARSTVN